MISTLGVAISCTVVLFLRFLFCFERNIHKAKKTGLPYVLSPVHELQSIAYLTDPILRWWCSGCLLQGKRWPRWARFMIKDWHYVDKGKSHNELGPIFIVVAAGGLVFYLASPSASMSALTHRKAFLKPREKMKVIEPFGPNIVTTDGDVWRRHSRITSPSFNEGVLDMVWSETNQQTYMLCEAWVEHSPQDLRANIYKLAMNIACFAIFGRPADWESDTIPAGHRMSLVTTMMELISNLAFILVLPQWVLRLLPSKRAVIASCAKSECEKYMQEFLTEEQRATNQDEREDRRKDNLLTALVKSSQESPHNSEPSADDKERLTAQEIKGNIFIYLLAGYETTANTLIYSCIVLAMYPEIQAQAREEVDAIHAQSSGEQGPELSYSQHYRKFRYLVAFMYETLRVFPIAFALARHLQDVDFNLALSDAPGAGYSSIRIPKGSSCVVNITGTHYLESNWCSPNIIEPKRWLSNEPNRYDPLNPPSPEAFQRAETIPCHVKGTFLAFGDGPRACLGRNIARVEFVAFMSRLLRSYELELEEGTCPETLEKKLRYCTGNSPVALTLSEAVKLRLRPRRV